VTLTKMQIKSHVPFVPDSELEARANLLLKRYCREIEPILRPPVPVEEIADFLLELNVEWGPISDTEDKPILAYIHAESKAIKLNELRQVYFDEFMGTYQFTLAHELGHYDLHLVESELEQLQFDMGKGKVFICRGLAKDRREIQANRFAGYLLMPSNLLQPAVEDIDLLHWPNLYELCERFSVSITALKIRLENLGLLYVDTDGSLHRSRDEAAGQLPLF
jgi:hypothetical protein